MTSNLQTAFMRYTTPAERRITRALILAALKRGWTITIFDGEEVTLKHATSLTAVTDALATTDSDTLTFRDEARKKIGQILLIWGNDEDVISDASESDEIETIIREAQA